MVVRLEILLVVATVAMKEHLMAVMLVALKVVKKVV